MYCLDADGALLDAAMLASVAALANCEIRKAKRSWGTTAAGRGKHDCAAAFWKTRGV